MRPNDEGALVPASRRGGRPPRGGWLPLAANPICPSANAMRLPLLMARPLRPRLRPLRASGGKRLPWGGMACPR